MTRAIIRKPMDIDEARRMMRRLFNPSIDMPIQDRYELIRAAYAFDSVWFAVKFGPFPEDAPYIARIESFRESEHGR